MPSADLKAAIEAIPAEYLCLLEAAAIFAEKAKALQAENARIRAALKPILARLDMPTATRSQTQEVMIQASELVELQAALGGAKG